ncbi:MAG: hypothetical protein ATN32_01590 [Candidatus Epulonipiscium fishelsonii]|nr:MAG: hypothetical protein ATN32_01590 [Epulopiscium sp. AS2M-Bin002]
MSEDNFLNIALNKLGRIFILNLFFIVTCIPIFTIGASLTALYQSTLKMVKNTDEAVLKVYFKAFKENFKQSTLTWLIFILMSVIIVVNVIFLMRIDRGIIFTVLLYSNIILGFALIIFLVYIFPVIATFDNTLGNLFKNSLIFGVANFHYTIVILIINFFPVSLTYVDITLLPLYAFCWFFFGFSTIAYLCSFIFYKIFVPYIK